MIKFIKIEEVISDDGEKNVSMDSEGFNIFEIIGLLTFYRDQLEVNKMYEANKKKEKAKK